MSWVDGFVGAIGKTPLIRIKSLSEKYKANILGKAEFMNPGGSVKDRTALALILDAERRGVLRPGGIVIEATSGNTGIGITHLCRSRGYRCVIYMAENHPRDKIAQLQALGAEIYLAQNAPWGHPQHYIEEAKRAADRCGAFFSNQFDNLANRQGHYSTTGPEIWEQCEGKIDGFVCAAGTGGTLGGVSMFLKEKSEGNVKIWCAEPPGGVVFDYLRNKAVPASGSRKVNTVIKGIAQAGLTQNLVGVPIDNCLRVPDDQSLQMTRDMLAEEGLFLGWSSGLNLVAACRMAKHLGEGSTIVTILCDNDVAPY
jgi:cysteine synthase A